MTKGLNIIGKMAKSYFALFIEDVTPYNAHRNVHKANNAVELAFRFL